MNLTDPEKLILSMLADISEHLKIKNGIDGKFVNSAITNGHTWAIKWKYSGLFKMGPLPPAVDEVFEMLAMWELTEQSYERLTASEKKRFESDKDPDISFVRFVGFDGNGESEQIGIADVLVNDLGNFAQFAGRKFNSHLPGSLARYQRMLPVFKTVSEAAHPKATVGPTFLNATELRKVLKADIRATGGLSLVPSGE